MIIPALYINIYLYKIFELFQKREEVMVLVEHRRDRQIIAKLPNNYIYGCVCVCVYNCFRKRTSDASS